MSARNQVEVPMKFLLCVLLTQLGKTFTAISKVRTYINEDPSEGKSIHIIFTMNTLLNNAQFASRLDSIESEYGKGSVVVFASSYDGKKYRHVRNRAELQGLCIDESTCPLVVLMCSNNVRYDDGFAFIKVLNNNNTPIKRVFVYYDELHKYITNQLRSQIEEIHDYNIVKGLMALTASPERIFNTHGFWSKLRTICLSNYSETDYCGFGDMIYNTVDDYYEAAYVRPGPFDFEALDSHIVGFISHILDKFPNILHNNARVFIPGHIRRVGHKAIRELVFGLKPNSIVIVINGEEKTMQYKDKDGFTKTLLLTSKAEEEVCETISRLITENGFTGRPIVVTGFLCVGMGQTLTHKTLGSFTAAIFGHMDLSNDELYQLHGRITGRMKGWGDKYVKTEVYCPTKIMHRCHVMEECARQMALEYNDDEVTVDDYRLPMKSMGEAGLATIENIRHVREKKVKSQDTVVDINLYRIYSNEEIVQAACNILGYHFVSIKNNDEGFKETSLNKKTGIVSLQNAVKKVPTAYGSNKGMKTYRTYYPCYVDVNKSDTLRFVVILRPGTDAAKIAECDNKFKSISL